MLSCRNQLITSLRTKNSHFKTILSFTTHLSSQPRPISTGSIIDPSVLTMTESNIIPPSLEFPKWGLLPKKETEVLNVLTKHPEWDGRGVVIAIFDSGVDPGAAGLQITSDKKPKVVERYDSSGSGDVDTSTVVKVDESGYITGLSGRKLKIPSNWTNPSGNFHIGLKNAYELYPKSVQDRIAKERKESKWDPSHKKAQAEAQRTLQDFIKKNGDGKTNNLNRENKLVKENLEHMIEALNTLEKKFNCHDVGPTYDVVVFNNGYHWSACVDTSEEGELSQCKLLGEYNVTLDFSPLTLKDQLNFSINVYEEGNMLELVGTCSGHGTHVASIAAGYFPGEPERNGVAPGAQIISCSIGDNRLGTMETGAAICRAMIRVMQRSPRPVHLINMSYGEHSHWSDSGRLAALMNKVVDETGVVWVCAAGNRGPALCTVGTPPDIDTNNIIGVGAYVSPDMMEAEYSLRERLPGTVYTWSSRGPTKDGGKGVTVVAPGGAITSVPNFTLRKTQLMNGTSMASPHACGAIALIISSLLQHEPPLSYSPYSIRRALEVTAQYIPSVEPYAQGFGLLQVEKALEWLKKYHDEIETNVRFHVTCGGSKNKGIHLRTGDQQVAKEISVTVSPVFADSNNIDPVIKREFEMSLSLTCSVPWVQIPNHLEVMNLPRQFNVKIDPSGLHPGVHNATIFAFDSKKPDKGHVFSVEVTVVKPLVRPPLEPKSLTSSQLSWNQVDFKPNTVNHHFVLVPKEATIAVLKIQANTLNVDGKFIVHCTQHKPKLSHAMEVHKVVTVNSQSEIVLPFNVYGDRILEVTIAKFWTNIGDINISYNLGFRGVRPDFGDTLNLYQHEGVRRIEVNGGVQIEDVLPGLSLKNSVTVLKPSETPRILPLTSKDIIPEGVQIYELVLNYSFHLNKAAEVTPANPYLSEILYESPFESQLWMLHDSQKRLLACGDAFPDKYHVKLEKGDYTIRHQVRHDRKDLLEKLQDMPMTLTQKLATPICMDIYSCVCQALTGGKKTNTISLHAGNAMCPLFIAPLTQDKLKTVNAHYLTGNVTFMKDETLKKADSWSVRYYLSEISKKNSSSTTNNNNNSNGNNKTEAGEKKTKLEEFEESSRDHKTTWLSKLEKGEAADKLFEELRTSHPQHVFVFSAMLQCLEPEAKKLLPGFKSDYSQEDDEQLVKVASSAIEAIDEKELLVFIGTKQDTSSGAAKLKQQMERQKLVLIDALSRKGAALCRLLNAGVATLSDGTGIDLATVDELYATLQKFTDPATDLKQAGYFSLWHAEAHKHYGRLLKLVLRNLEDKVSRELLDVLIFAAQQAGARSPPADISSGSASSSQAPPSEEQRLLQHIEQSISAMLPVLLPPPEALRPF